MFATLALQPGDIMKLLQSWYIYLARGIFAIALGILLVSDKARWNTLQYMACSG